MILVELWQKMERRLFEEMERVVAKLTKKDIDRLTHDLDHCLLMANKFYETKKPEYYVRMEASCEKFLETLKALRSK